MIAVPAQSHAPAPHAPADLQTLLAELDASLGETTKLLTELVALADRKLVALRGADTLALHQTARAEGAALERTFALEQQRSAILARLAQVLPSRKVVRQRLSEVAEVLPPPWQGKIGEKTRVLRRLAKLLQEKNRLAAGVAQNLHKHIRAVFEELAQHAQPAQGYDRTGQHETGPPTNWVDATG